MKKVRTGLLAALAAFGLVAGALGTPAVAGKIKSAPLKGEGEGLEIVANIPYSGGTDMEYTTIKGKPYAFVANGVAAADEPAGLRVIDISNPEKPKVVAFLPCRMNQGDIQISHDKKYVYMASDSAGGPDSCLGVGQEGFQVFDVRNPAKPKAVGFAVTGSSHNVTAHPKKPYVYNSNSSLAGKPEIQIWNVKNPAKPELVKTFPSLPHAPHDISFNKDGSKIVTAAISHFDIFDTSDPENPSLEWTGQCPGCSITHDAKFLPDGSGLIIGDEGGGGGAYPCPGGQLHFYQLQADAVPVYTGVYAPEEIVLARDGQSGPAGCTSHVFEISDDGKEVAISWYSAGTRYLDVSAMMGASLGSNSAPGGVTELGWFMPEGGSSWSSKFLNQDGKYIFSNDIQRGFDVFKISK
jgi:hypothetical protein